MGGENLPEGETWRPRLGLEGSHPPAGGDNRASTGERVPLENSAIKKQKEESASQLRSTIGVSLCFCLPVRKQVSSSCPEESVFFLFGRKCFPARSVFLSSCSEASVLVFFLSGRRCLTVRSVIVFLFGRELLSSCPEASVLVLGVCCLY